MKARCTATNAYEARLSGTSSGKGGSSGKGQASRKGRDEATLFRLAGQLEQAQPWAWHKAVLAADAAHPAPEADK